METWIARFSGVELTRELRDALDRAGLILTGSSHFHGDRYNYGLYVDAETAHEAIDTARAALAGFEVTVDPDAEPSPRDV